MRPFLVSQHASLFLFLQLPMSLMDNVSASPQLVSATLPSLFHWKSSFVFAKQNLTKGFFWFLSFCNFVWFLSFRGFFWFCSFWYQHLHESCQQRFWLLLFIGHLAHFLRAHENPSLAVVQTIDAIWGTSPSFAWKNVDSSTIPWQEAGNHIVKNSILLYGQNLNLHLADQQLHPLPWTSFKADSSLLVGCCLKLI